MNTDMTTIGSRSGQFEQMQAKAERLERELEEYKKDLKNMGG